jgi:large subunit ribosomal protein L25
MKEITFEVTSRHKKGKGVARKLRAGGTIPGVIYGKGESPVPIEINYNQFVTTMRKAGGENLLINLSVDGKESPKKALLREVQRDPINGKPLHLDFQHISLTEKIHIQVPIVLEGTPEGVKNLGGIMSWVVRHVEVSCLPTDIPDKITVDVSALKLHESIHVKELNIVGAEILSDPDETIVTVVPPTITKEETPAPAEGEAAAAAEAITPEGEEPTEPEVISEKKAEERRAEKEKAEKKPEKGEKKKE